MKSADRSKRNHSRARSRFSIGIGTGISILLIFSCIVGADSIMSDSADRTEGENYDMVSPANSQTSDVTITETTVVVDPSAPVDPSDPNASSDPSDPSASSDPSDPSYGSEITTPTPTPKPSYTEEPWEGIYYTIGEVNVRKGPGTEYDITKVLEPGDAIEVVGRTSNGWYHTVRDTYVAVEMVSSEPPADPTPTPKPSKKYSDPTPTPKPSKKKNSDPTPTPKPEPEPEKKPSKDGMTLVGSDFRITFYGPDWAGPGTDNRTTASGTTCKEGRTIAVDPSVIPIGSTVYIENDPLGGDGYYTAEDTGYGVNSHSIDIFAEDGESMSTLHGYTVYIVN